MDEEKEENTQPGHAVQQPGPHTRLTFVHAFLNSSRHGATMGVKQENPLPSRTPSYNDDRRKYARHVLVSHHARAVILSLLHYTPRSRHAQTLCGFDRCPTTTGEKESKPLKKFASRVYNRVGRNNSSREIATAY